MTFPAPETVAAVRSIPLVSELRWLERAGSTNALVMDAAAAGAPEGLVVGAEEQTAGRGRRGRSWHAPAGTSLMLSVLLRPTIPPVAWPVLPLLAGIAVHRTAQATCPGVDAGLKWPNDLLLAGTKAAGILVEAGPGVAVVGIGLNVDWRGVPRPADLRATSLAEHADVPPGRDAVLVDLLRTLGEEYTAAGRDPAGVVARYVPRCATIGVQVVAHGAAGGRDTTGTAVGLTTDGHLRVRTGTGEEVVLTAGEVEHLR